MKRVLKKKEKKEIDTSFIYDMNDNRTKLIYMLGFIILVILGLSLTSKDNGNTLKGTPFDKNYVKSDDNVELEDNFDNYLSVLSKISNKTYEYTYTIEPDDENEYLLIKGQVDREKTLYYKDYKGKEKIYLKKGSNYYILGTSTWKKTNKEMSYEGYDKLLLNPTNIYKLLNEKESYETKEEDGIVKSYVKVDMNKLINLYNESSSIEESIKDLEEKKYILFTVYRSGNHLIIEADLKDYYKLVYNKEYNNIFYGMEYYNIGKSSLSGIEDYIKGN